MSLSVFLSLGSSQPRPPERRCPCLSSASSSSSSSSSCLGTAAAAHCGEAKSDGPETGPVGPDGRRGGARAESGPTGHEAAKERGGEAEVRWDYPARASFRAFLEFERRWYGGVNIRLWAEMSRHSGVLMGSADRGDYHVLPVPLSRSIVLYQPHKTDNIHTGMEHIAMLSASSYLGSVHMTDLWCFNTAGTPWKELIKLCFKKGYWHLAHYLKE